MSKKGRVVNRIEMFDLGWEKPTRQLAEEFGVSDAALGKICKRMDILKPPRGYWAKTEAGRKLEGLPQTGWVRNWGQVKMISFSTAKLNSSSWSI